MAGQEDALGAAADQGSARPLSTFVAVIYGGVFCGSALGGVIAARLGFEATFLLGALLAGLSGCLGHFALHRSEEHTSELQSLMRISYAVFCLKKNKKEKTTN